MDLHDQYLQSPFYKDQEARKKLLEELNLRNPEGLPGDAMSRLPSMPDDTLSTSGIPPANPNFEVNVSGTTANMGGRQAPAENYAPATPEEMAAMHDQPNYRFKKGEAIAPVEPTPATPAKTAKSGGDPEADAILAQTGNDDARRQAELEALKKRSLGNNIASFGAGIGDAISASSSAFGGNAPGGFQQRLIERQGKQLASDKKSIEDSIRNDANSDISKQYQALVGQFLQKDPKDPTILGLTANQIAEKIPQIEKLATLRQTEELKRAEMANERAVRGQAASTKSLEDAEKKQLAAAEEKQQANVIRQTISDIKGKNLIGWDTAGPLGSKWVAPMDKPTLERKLDTIKGNIAFDKLNKLRQASPTGGAVGQVSDKDMGLLQSVLGSLSTDQHPDELRSSLKTIDAIFAKFQGYGEPSPTSDSAQPQGDIKTKSGITFRKVKRNG